jgi:hypothetical protein
MLVPREQSFFLCLGFDSPLVNPAGSGIGIGRGNQPVKFIMRLVARPVTHEKPNLWVWFAIAIGIAIGIGFSQYGTADSDCDTDSDTERFGCRFIFEAVPVLQFLSAVVAIQTRLGDNAAF